MDRKNEQVLVAEYNEIKDDDRTVKSDNLVDCGQLSADPILIGLQDLSPARRWSHQTIILYPD